MKTIELLALLLAGSLSYCTNNTTTRELSESDKEKLIPTIEKFNKAFQEGNLTALKSMITENYLHTNGNAKVVRKEDWLKYLNKREQQIKSGELEVLHYKMDEIETEFHGTSAIVTARIIVSSKEKGEIRTSEYRVTNIWITENDTWKRAGFHDGKVQ